MEPILNGAPGFILLALAVALGAYLRTVAVAASDTYDKIITQEKPDLLWPRGTAYTEARLRNLHVVYECLRWVTMFMFAFICAAALRTVFWAMSVIPQYSKINSKEGLFLYDLILVSVLAGSFAVMWLIHFLTSRKEAIQVRRAREAREKSRIAKAPVHATPPP
jgi:hypothetical protein